MRKLSLLFILCLTLSACTSVGVVKKDVSLDNSKESIFVAGLRPDNYRVSFFRGSVKDGVFRPNMIMPALFYGAATDGYIVGKAPAGLTLAITYLTIVKNETSLLGARYLPCEKEHKTLTFKVPAGKVIYLGEIQYQYQNGGIGLNLSKKFNAAKSYIDTNYPNLEGRIETWESKLLPTNQSCIEYIYLPVSNI